MSFGEGLLYAMGGGVTIYSVLSAVALWRTRRVAVWDVQRQMWRAASGVVRDRRRHRP